MRTFIDGNCLVNITDSPLDLVECGVRELDSSPCHAHYTSRVFERSGWLHRKVRSTKEYREGFAGPDRISREKIDREIERIKKLVEIDTPEVIRPRPAWGDEDGEIDIDRAFDGNDDCLRTRKKGRRVQTKNITVVYTATATAGVTANDMMRAGAGVAAAVELLEEAGYSVELWVVMAARDGGETGDVWTACRIKESGEPANSDVLANVFSPDLFRLPGFGLMSNLSLNRRSSGGYGGPDQKMNYRMQSKHLNFGNDQVIQTECGVAGGSQASDPIAQAKRIIREATEA